MNMRIPYAIEDRAIWKYAYVDIWHNDIMKVSFLFVREKQIGHPNPISLSKRKIFEPFSKIVEF